MTADEIRLRRQSALPLGRDSGAPAQGQKQQGKNAAVAGEIPGTVFRHVFQNYVVGHIGVLHIQGDEVVKCPGLCQRIRQPFRQFSAQSLEIRREDDMWRLLLNVKVIASGDAASMIGVRKDSRVQIGIFHAKFVVFFHGFFPANGTLRGVLRGDSAGLRPNLLNADIALLLTGGGNGKMGPQEHTGGKEFVLQPYSGPDADAVGQGTVLLHFLHGDIQSAVSLRAAKCAFHAGKR